MRRFSPRASFCAITLALAFGLAGNVRADVVYLALGDSVTFGYDPSTAASQAPSYADQGFVRPFADFLASVYGGKRPDVLNLAISGELSTSFFSGTSPPGWPNRAPELNKNYDPPNDTMAQFDLMKTSINAIHAAGNRVGVETFLIGGNDVFYLVGSPAFQNASAADKEKMIVATLTAIQANYVKALTELTALAPEAKLLLPGYYNPFPPGPEHDFFNSILASFNPTVAADAAAFKGTYVDFYTPIAGKELLLTNIGTGDIHPNQAGYQALALALEPSVVPEPSVYVLMGVSLAGLAAYKWCRRESTSRASA